MFNDNRLKASLTLDEQIELLKSRGMIINNDFQAKRILSYVSYYRLSAYSLGLRDQNDIFNNNVTIEKIYNIYLFDENFRKILSAVIEPIEIKLRGLITNHLAVKYGNVCHLVPALFENSCRHSDFMSYYDSSLNQHMTKRTPFVKHNMQKYGKLPIWAAVEILSFGQLSMFYKNLKKEDRKIIANSFGVDDSFFAGWIESLCYIRNICAHSARIYNRVITKKPRLYTEDRVFDKPRMKIFPIIVIIGKIYDYSGDEWDTFIMDFSQIIRFYEDDINLAFMDLPQDWQSILNAKRPAK